MKPRRTNWFAIALVVVGLLAGVGAVKLWPAINQLLSTSNELRYVSSSAALLEQASEAHVVGWRDLLPESEFDVIKRYQPEPDQPLNKQVFSALQATFDDDYQATLNSTAVVPSLDGKVISIGGFIVPLTVSEKREILTAFLVPYFGACIHFPPPAPNQIIYLRTPKGFTLDNIEQALMVTGVVKTALFEDVQGTSAYVMDVINIRDFNGTPDDVRRHDLQQY